MPASTWHRLVVHLTGEPAITRTGERHRDCLAAETLAAEMELRDPEGCGRMEEDTIDAHDMKVGVSRQA